MQPLSPFARPTTPWPCADSAMEELRRESVVAAPRADAAARADVAARPAAAGDASWAAAAIRGAGGRAGVEAAAASTALTCGRVPKVG